MIKPTILIIEDDPDQLENLNEMLNAQFNPILAQSGQEAIEKYANTTKNIEIILSEIVDAFS